MRRVSRHYTLRPAGSADIEALIDIDLAAGQLFDGTGLLKPEALMDHVPRDVFEHAIERGDVRVAAHTSGEIAGFTLASHRGGLYYLDQISVHPEHGRRGLGRTLMRDVLRTARSRRYKIVALSTFRDIAWNGPFYRQLGFREIARRKLSDWMIDLEATQAASLDVSKRCFMRRRVAWI